MKFSSAPLNNRLLLLHTLSYILGIALFPHYISTPHLLLILCVVSIATASIFLRINRTLCLFCSLLFFCLMGTYQATIKSQLPHSQTHIYSLVKKPVDVVVVGHLLSMATWDGTTSRALLEIDGIKSENDTLLQQASGKVLLRMRAPWPSSYEPGSRLIMRATLQRPTSWGTPGTFDYRAYLAQKDIWVTGKIQSQAMIRPISPQLGPAGLIRFYPEILRHRVGQFIDQNLSSPFNGLYRALLLGDRSHIPYHTLESFKSTGTMHILAISGIHMTLIGALLFTSIYWLLRRSESLTLNFNVKKTAALLSIPALVSYALLAGNNSPVVRACIMSLIVITALCTNRRTTLSELVALAALLILMVSPLELFSASFQLTFAAFCAITASLTVIQEKILPHRHPGESSSTFLHRSVSWLQAALLTSSAAVLGTAPVVIYHFHRLPLLGPLSNLLLEPLICLWALPFGFLSLPLIWLFPSLAAIFLKAGAYGLHASLRLASLLEQTPYSTIWPPEPGPLLIVGYYAAFALLFIALDRHWIRSWLYSIPYLFCLLILLTPDLRVTNEKVQTPVIDILDVGQGSAALIRLPDKKAILIDGGGSSYSKESVGRRIIAPYFWSQGITRLEAVIITHPDSDHYNGIPFILKHFPTRNIWVRSSGTSDANYQHLLDTAAAAGTNVIQVKPGHTLTFHGGSLRCLDDTSTHRDSPGGRNEGLVLQLSYGQQRVLFPGDIDQAAENRLILKPRGLQSNVLLAAHHGSVTSNSALFLKEVKPEVIIASAGRSGRRIFPSKKLRSYCQERMIPLLTTARHGTLRIVMEDGGYTVYIQDRKNKNPLRRSQHEWAPAPGTRAAETAAQFAVTPL